MTRTYGRSGTIFWRVESTQVETDVLRTGVHTFQGGRKNAHIVEEGRRDFVGAFSRRGDEDTDAPPVVGHCRRRNGDRRMPCRARCRRSTATRPLSFQIFLRVRPPARHRMTDMTMTRPGM